MSRLRYLRSSLPEKHCWCYDNLHAQLKIAYIIAQCYRVLFDLNLKFTCMQCSLQSQLL